MSGRRRDVVADAALAGGIAALGMAAVRRTLALATRQAGRATLAELVTRWQLLFRWRPSLRRRRATLLSPLPVPAMMTVGLQGLAAQEWARA
jgi:hypothetical protein